MAGWMKKCIVQRRRVDGRLTRAKIRFSSASKLVILRTRPIYVKRCSDNHLLRFLGSLELLQLYELIVIKHMAVGASQE